LYTLGKWEQERLETCLSIEGCSSSGYECRRVLRDVSLIPFTPHTIVDPHVLREELEHIRDVGVAYDREEALVGLSCVAAPIYDFTGEVIAALSISLPTVRFLPAESCLTNAVKEATSEISRSLGYLPTARGYRFSTPGV
jgi:IclR family transcriptional regulator, KDG regulon repressor